MRNPTFQETVGRALASGAATPGSAAHRLSEAAGGERRWMRPLARRYAAAFASRTRPRLRDVTEFLEEDSGFAQVKPVEIRQPGPEPVMAPVPAARNWKLPPIETAGDLADFLEITREELDWFADLRGWGGRRSDSPLAHYRYRLIEKRSGRLRLIEAPKPRLKALQRRILDDVLAPAPGHEAVHGFRKRRSIVTFAEPHAGRQAVLKMDLRDFFPSIRRARISALFRTMGYPESTADLLAGLATNRTPRDVWSLPVKTATPTERKQITEARDLHTSAHLPQGAPTSPALANLCFYRADCRLSALAAAAGARYTRYADDLAFSGDRSFAQGAHDFAVRAAVLLGGEGFAVEQRKTRIMRSGVRQRLAGVVVNQRVNVERREYDRLKAILTNCIRYGPQTQNRDGRPDFRGYLEGRTAFVTMVHPGRGERLRKLLTAIEWE